VRTAGVVVRLARRRGCPIRNYRRFDDPSTDVQYGSVSVLHPARAPSVAREVGAIETLRVDLDPARRAREMENDPGQRGDARCHRFSSTVARRWLRGTGELAREAKTEGPLQPWRPTMTQYQPDRRRRQRAHPGTVFNSAADSVKAASLEIAERAGILLEKKRAAGRGR